MSGCSLQTFLYCVDIADERGKEAWFKTWDFMKGIRKLQEILKLKVVYVYLRGQDIVAVN